MENLNLAIIVSPRISESLMINLLGFCSLCLKADKDMDGQSRSVKGGYGRFSMISDDITPKTGSFIFVAFSIIPKSGSASVKGFV